MFLKNVWLCCLYVLEKCGTSNKSSKVCSFNSDFDAVAMGAAWFLNLDDNSSMLEDGDG